MKTVTLEDSVHNTNTSVKLESPSKHINTYCTPAPVIMICTNIHLNSNFLTLLTSLFYFCLLLRHIYKILRCPGIEPGSQEWESCMIPLHQQRYYIVDVNLCHFLTSYLTNLCSLYKSNIHIIIPSIP